MQQAGALAFLLELLDLQCEHLVEIASVGQARQRIVQRIELDALLGRLEFGVARFGQHVGALELFGKRHIRRHVPVDARHARRGVGILVGDACLADMAHHAVRQQQPVFRVVAAHRIDRAPEIVPGVLDIVGMHPSFPIHVAAWSTILGQPEQLIGAVVPIKLVCFQVELPDPDPGGVQRQREPARQPLQLHLAAAQFVDVLEPLVDQPPRNDRWNEDQRPAGQDQQPQHPGICWEHVPAALWNCGDPPGARTAAARRRRPDCRLRSAHRRRSVRRLRLF